MTCEQAIERLPWFLNGTLETAEREEIREHLAICQACRAALSETREAWRIFGQHLPAGVLVALAHGEPPSGLDPVLAERHLASCPECAADLELARMSRQLEEDDRIATFPAGRVRETGRGHRAWRGAAMAAGLTGLIAFSGWFQAAQRSGLVPELEARNQEIQQKQAELEAGVKDMQGRLAEIAQPQINIPAPTLQPNEVVRGETPEISIPGGQIATLILQPSPGVSAPERDIALLDESGKLLWQKSGLRLSNSQDFTIRYLFKPGRYTIQLYTIENGQRVPREQYVLRVQ